MEYVWTAETTLSVTARTCTLAPFVKNIDLSRGVEVATTTWEAYTFPVIAKRLYQEGDLLRRIGHIIADTDGVSKNANGLCPRSAFMKSMLSRHFVVVILGMGTSQNLLLIFLGQNHAECMAICTHTADMANIINMNTHTIGTRKEDVTQVSPLNCHARM